MAVQKFCDLPAHQGRRNHSRFGGRATAATASRACFDVPAVVETALHAYFKLPAPVETALQKCFGLPTVVETALHKYFGLPTAVETALQKYFGLPTAVETGFHAFRGFYSGRNDFAKCKPKHVQKNSVYLCVFSVKLCVIVTQRATEESQSFTEKM